MRQTSGSRTMEGSWTRNIEESDLTGWLVSGCSGSGFGGGWGPVPITQPRVDDGLGPNASGLSFIRSLVRSSERGSRDSPGQTVRSVESRDGGGRGAIGKLNSRLVAVVSAPAQPASHPPSDQ